MTEIVSTVHDALRAAPPEVLVSLAIAALLVLGAVIAALRLGARGERGSMLRRALGSMRAPIIAAGLAFAASAAAPILELEPETRSALAVTARVLGVLSIGWAVAAAGDMILRRLTERAERRALNDLQSRARATKLNILRRIWIVVAGFLALGAALISIPSARDLGVSLFASAGVLGIVVGVAAQPVLSNLVAGLQLAFTQPMRIDDAVYVEGEWGWIEEIGLFHVVVRIWDLRRLVVPLTYFANEPFENWTRSGDQLIGQVTWRLDYRAPIAAMRERLDEILKASELHDGEVSGLQVIDSDAATVTVRAIASAPDSPKTWDLRCHVRETMVEWLQREHPYALPRLRQESDETQREGEPAAWAAQPEDSPRTRASESERDPSLRDRAGGAGAPLPRTQR